MIRTRLRRKKTYRPESSRAPQAGVITVPVPWISLNCYQQLVTGKGINVKTFDTACGSVNNTRILQLKSNPMQNISKPGVLYISSTFFYHGKWKHNTIRPYGFTIWRANAENRCHKNVLEA
jgi:hypothetical protein